MREMTKQVKRALRDMSAMAHEEELRRALLPLAEAFDAWRAGKLGSGALTERIHEFHQGPARELFQRYDSPTREFAVAYAVVSGIISKGPSSR